MKNFFLKTGFLLLIVFFQLSFLNILFPAWPSFILPLAAVVAWTLALGFPKSLTMTVPLVLIFDILGSGGLTALSLYATLLAYATSFFSRRLLIERQGFGVFLYALFSAGAVLGYQAWGLLRLVLPESFPEVAALLPPLTLSVPSILFSGLLSGVFFIGIYALVRRFEKYLEQALRRQFSAVK